MLKELKLPSLDDYIQTGDRDRFAELVELLALSGINLVRNPTLVRGLDYYSGTCFEVKCNSNELLGES